jgi:hypothetical protein
MNDARLDLAPPCAGDREAAAGLEIDLRCV